MSAAVGSFLNISGSDCEQGPDGGRVAVGGGHWQGDERAHGAAGSGGGERGGSGGGAKWLLVRLPGAGLAAARGSVGVSERGCGA